MIGKNHVHNITKSRYNCDNLLVVTKSNWNENQQLNSKTQEKINITKHFIGSIKWINLKYWISMYANYEILTKQM